MIKLKSSMNFGLEVRGFIRTNVEWKLSFKCKKWMIQLIKLLDFVVKFLIIIDKALDYDWEHWLQLITR